MPAIRKPTNVLALTGSLRKDPGRHAARLTEPTPAGPISAAPPATLSEVEALAWLQIVRQCPPRVLTDADEALVELAAKLLAAIRYGDPPELVKAGPLLIKCLSLLGMSPADRSRVSAAAPRGVPDDPDKEFFG